MRITQPIDIKTKTALDKFTSKEPAFNLLSLSTSPTSSNAQSFPSSYSSNSQLEFKNAPIARRMSLNFCPSAFSRPFFGVSATGSEHSHEDAVPRRTRTLSASNADASRLAEKWGFGIKAPSNDSSLGTFSRFSKGKPRPNAMEQLAEESKARPRSPMGDMILKGQFLD
ncbi:hypothetical protein L0F63_002311 [Massospora cicadina]|nr:hypothetical protein L0F63_002311 [Massospora cicadina]